MLPRTTVPTYRKTGFVGMTFSPAKIRASPPDDITLD